MPTADVRPPAHWRRAAQLVARVLLHVVALACAVLILVAGFLAVLGACVAAFIATGQLAAGEPMFHELLAPGLVPALGFVAVAVLVAGALVWVRKRLLRWAAG